MPLVHDPQSSGRGDQDAAIVLSPGAVLGANKDNLKQFCSSPQILVDIVGEGDEHAAEDRGCAM